MKRSISLLTIIFTLITAGCGDDPLGLGHKEEIHPIMGSKRLTFEAIPMEFEAKIASRRIKASVVHQGVDDLLGWLPFVGPVLLMPVDFVTSVLGPFPVEESLDFQFEGPWTDPKVLPLIQSVRVTEAWLEITPEEDRENFKKSMWCKVPGYGTVFCKDNFNFLSEIAVHVWFPPDLKFTEDGKPVFEKDKHGKPVLDKDGNPKQAQLDLTEEEIRDRAPPLARATKDKNMSNKKRRIDFDMTGVNLVPLVKQYGNHFEIKIFAKGKPPKRDIFLHGGVKMEVILQIPDPY